MKILLVNKFHYIKGGSETYYFGLAELLKKYGHEVIFFSMHDDRNFPCEQAKYFVDNVDFNADVGLFKKLNMAKKMLYSKEAAKKFEALIKAEHPDLIHLNIFQSQLTGSIVDVAHKYGIPMVYTAHDLKSVCPNYQMLNHGEVCEKCLHGDYKQCFKTACMKDSKLKSLLAYLEARTYRKKKTYKKLNAVITPSAFYKTKLDESGVMNCPVVHMANFLPEGTEYRASGVVGEYILYFGRLSREKGVMTLVKAYMASNCSLPLYIVGTGPIENDIKSFVEENDLTQNVKLLGFKQGEELKKLVRESRCVCLVSEWYENGPYSIMEAMAAGKPAIVSNLGGLPELVEDGKTGYIVPSKDIKALSEAIDKICALPDEELLQMGENAVLRAKELFDCEKYVDKLVGIYEELV